MIYRLCFLNKLEIIFSYLNTHFSISCLLPRLEKALSTSSTSDDSLAQLILIWWMMIHMGRYCIIVPKWEVSENKNQYSWKSEKHRLSLQSALKRNEMYQQVLGSFRNLQTWKFELWEAPKSSIFLSVLWFFLPWRVENGRSPEWLMSWVNVCSWQGHSCVKDL